VTRRGAKRFAVVAAALVAVLLAARAAAPFVVKHYVNRHLANLGEYRGHVAEVSLFLWRGGYGLRDLDIVKIASKTEVPFAAIPQMDLTLQWNALLHGHVVGEALIHEPALNFVRSESAESSQLGTGTNWPEQIRNLFPFRLNLVEVRNGLVTFQAPGIQENEVLTMRDTQLVLRNLTNVEGKNEQAFAEIDMNGRVMGNAPVKLTGKIDPNAEAPTFDIDLSLEGAKLVDVNPWLRRFLKVDAAAGAFSMYSELASAKGHFEGYVKPILENPKITESKEETHGPFQKVWAGLVALAAKIFENRAEKDVATKIPLRGDIEDPKAGILAAIVNLARNAFVAAFSHSLENSITLRDAAEDVRCLNGPEDRNASGKGEPAKKHKKKDPCQSAISPTGTH
jgi:Domain of Unknown Function (DUF748)